MTTNSKTTWDDRLVNWFHSLPRYIRWFALPLIIPLLLVYSTLAIGVLIVVGLPYATVTGWWQSRRFFGQLRESGRIVRWSDIHPLLEAGQGTLILAESLKGPISVAWWVPHRLSLNLEHALPTYRQLMQLEEQEADWLLFESAWPAVEEFANSYSHPEHGTAAWVELPKPLPDWLSDAIPESSVLVTVDIGIPVAIRGAGEKEEPTARSAQEQESGDDS